MKHWGPVGRWQCRCLLIRQSASNAGRGDFSDLVPIDKSMAAIRGDHDSVKLVQVRYL
jgi:hypothetical protein